MGQHRSCGHEASIFFPPPTVISPAHYDSFRKLTHAYSYTTKGFVHWDLNPWDSNKPFGIQGVLCLADTAPNQGGFHCIPGMHKYLSEWLKKFPAKQADLDKWNTRGIPIRVPEKALKTKKLHIVDAKAGDLIVWRRELAHGNGFNQSELPRLAQYITFFPARSTSDQRQLTPQENLEPDGQNERIRLWKNNLAPTKFGHFKDPWPQPANLTDLGKKLLGLDPWEDDYDQDENGEKEQGK